MTETHNNATEKQIRMELDFLNICEPLMYQKIKRTLTPKVIENFHALVNF